MKCNEPITVLKQLIDADFAQSQAVEQTNASLQGVAVAIAIGTGSKALASQEAEQCNKNSQFGKALAINKADDLCGECIDKSERPDANLFQNRDERQQNTYFQLGVAAISIFGGNACAEQTIRQLNSNTQFTALIAKNLNDCDRKQNTKAERSSKPENPNRKLHRSNDIKEKTLRAKAYPTRLREIAVVAIDMGSYQLKLQVAANGAVYLNGKKIKSAKKK